ncbi:zinc finger BED domain-containing protein 4 [Elysia marginata]|uniref:Zinc finger BED domain-containing protein 4 n=1 Tax=Elysia marginata TaxID=1093978 RepID=A0AAV4J7T2_9GAST|nr:zinc finger BED domain-containing protein 4 [Elysia marginata]
MAPSIVWTYMERIDSNLIECKLCDKQFAYNHSTTSLLKHLYRAHPGKCGARPSNRSKAENEDMTAAKNLRPFVEMNCDEDDSEQSDNQNGDNLVAINNRTRPRESVVWTFMDRPDETTVACKLCDAKFVFQRSTSSLLRHIYNRHPEQCGAHEPHDSRFYKAYLKYAKNSIVRDIANSQKYKREHRVENSAQSLESSCGVSDENSIDSNDEQDIGDFALNSSSSKKNSTKHLKRNRSFHTGNLKPKAKRLPQAREMFQKNYLYLSGRKTPSICWNFMNKHSPTETSCKICKKKFYVVRGSTTNMLNHLKSVHPEALLNGQDEQWVEAYLSKSNASLSNEAETPVSGGTELAAACHTDLSPVRPAESSTSNHQASSTSAIKPFPKMSMTKYNRHHEHYLNLVISELLPCSFVESAGFQNFIKALRLNLTIPDQNKMEADILKLHQTQQNQVQQQIDGAAGISLSTEVWDYKEGHRYMSVTGHFISGGWERQSFILKTVLLDPTLDLDAAISDELGVILRQWKIEDKVTCIVSEDTEALNTAVLQLKIPYVQCVAHKLNLIVQESLKLSNYFGYLSGKVKYIASLLRHTSGASEKLKELQTSQGRSPSTLPQDSELEWMSTFKMLKSYQSLHSDDVLKLVLDAENGESLLLEPEEFECLNLCIGLLEPFALAAEELKSESFVSLSKTIPVCEILQQMLSTQVEVCSGSSLAEQDAVTGLAGDLNQRLDQYVRTNVKNSANLLSVMATLLDPRFKLTVSKDADIFTMVENELQRQIDQNETVATEEKTPELLSGEVTPSKHVTSFLWSSFDETVKTAVRERPVNEVHRYIEESPVSRQENPLQYWKDREVLYPKLCKVVKKFLAVPATSVPASQVFSGEEKKKISRRSFIKESNLDSMLFLNSFQSMTLE